MTARKSLLIPFTGTRGDSNEPHPLARTGLGGPAAGQRIHGPFTAQHSTRQLQPRELVPPLTGEHSQTWFG